MDQQTRDVNTLAAIALLQGTLTGASAQQGGLTQLNSVLTGPYPTTPTVAPKTVYPKLDLPPTDAFVSGIPVGTNLLCTQMEAMALAAELGLTTMPRLDQNDGVIYTGDRKKYILDVPGCTALIFAGFAIWSKCRAGIGAPGKWVKIPVGDKIGLVWQLDDATGDAWQIDPKQVVAL